VGGAVRDELLGRPVRERDWVVVGAAPAELERLGFRQVGKDFPVFLHPETYEEYALARTERKVAPGYHGFETRFSPDVTLVEDLLRRDLTINAMAAADAVVVPLQCEFFALEGLSQLLKTVDQVRESLNPGLSIHGIVLTMFDARNNLCSQVVDDVRAFMGTKVYDTVIPRNVRVSEAPSHGKPVLLYDLKSTGAQAYLRLASEVIQRERALQAA